MAAAWIRSRQRMPPVSLRVTGRSTRRANSSTLNPVPRAVVALDNPSAEVNRVSNFQPKAVLCPPVLPRNSVREPVRGEWHGMCFVSRSSCKGKNRAGQWGRGRFWQLATDAKRGSCWVGRIVSRTGKAAGIVVGHGRRPNKRPVSYADAHDLLRSCADGIVAAGGPERIVQRISGHSAGPRLPHTTTSRPGWARASRDPRLTSDLDTPTQGKCGERSV